ncbi:mechanosensitive ion channel family protein [Nanoarchaeota archaeon]
MAIDWSVITNYFSTNVGGDYVTAFWVFIIILIGLKLLGVYILYFFKSISKRTKTQIDDMMVNFISRIKWPFFLYMAFYAGTRFLILPDLINTVLNYLLVIFVGFYVIVGLNKAINKFTDYQIKKKGDNSGTSMIKILAIIAKIAIWIIAFLMILSNLGIEITPLIASLGVGGIAIALALQVILGDLFAAFSIYFDKPFQEGDFIIMGKDMGIVKNIGIKSTRISTLQGQELVVSNSEMISSRINNYKKMRKRRISFGFGVEYGTKTAKLKKIPKMVGEIFKKIKLADIDRVHFKEFGDSALLYEVVYYLNTGDYTKYMDTQEDINLGIKEAFEKEKISMAFPTQTIHIKK